MQSLVFLLAEPLGGAFDLAGGACRAGGLSVCRQVTRTFGCSTLIARSILSSFASRARQCDGTAAGIELGSCATC